MLTTMLSLDHQIMRDKDRLMLLCQPMSKELFKIVTINSARRQADVARWCIQMMSQVQAFPVASAAASVPHVDNSAATYSDVVARVGLILRR